MVAALRQHGTGFAAGGVTTLAANLSSGTPLAALPGSLLVWIIGGDKNVGTVTKPADCPNLPIDLKTADVSLALAWGYADGGETALSGSVATNTAGSQVWALEITDPDGDGTWVVALQITVLTPGGGSNVTQLLIGPTGDAATIEGIGISAVAFDSVNTAGTPTQGTWDNGYVSHRITNSGGGQAGLWGAIKPVVDAGEFDWTWFQRGAGASADQAHGFLIVFGQEVGATEGAGEAAFGALAAGGSALVRREGTGAAAFAPLAADGTGFEIVQVVADEGVALFGALEGSGRAIHPPPTDLPLQPGTVVLAPGWAGAAPTIAAGIHGGPPAVR